MGKQSIVKRFQGQISVDNVVGGKGLLAAIRMSFETGEAGLITIKFPYKVKILLLRSIVTKALSDTDAGTITPANATGNMANGTITHALSAALGNTIEATPTTNQVIEKDADLKLTSAKTTVVGKVAVTVHYLKLA